MSGFFLSSSILADDILQSKGMFLNSRVQHNEKLTITKRKSLCYAHTIIEEITDTNADVVLLDGNIFNKESFTDLNKESDRHFLLHLYRKYGEEMLTKINGSFSFVLYDSDKNILFGAKDRLGEKPLYYSLHNGNFECSSSLKSLCCGKRCSINENAKNLYIRYGWIYDSECIFNEVHKVAAGEYFLYDVNTNEIKISKYWTIPNNTESLDSMDNEDLVITKLDELISDSVSIRLSEDDTIGMGISSGTDSFTIYSCLLNSGCDVPLFNIVPKHSISIYDEFPLANRHVKSINPSKHIERIALSDADCIKGLDDSTLLYDEPNSDFSCIITSSLFRIMHQNYGITLAFSGIGADDILFGKPIYKYFLDKIERYELSSSVLSEFCITPPGCSDAYRRLLSNDDILSLQHYDIKTYLPNLLIKEDVVSQNYGISIRNPFCDYRLVEYCSMLDIDLLYKNKRFKYLLKELLLKKFNINFFNDSKRGFAPEITTLFGISDIRERIMDILNITNMNKFFPEIPFNVVNNAINENITVKHAQLLLNLYFYISIISNYNDNILSK